jgi:Methyltransferase domain
MASAVMLGGVVVGAMNVPTYHQRNGTRWAKVRFDAVKPFLRAHAVAAELGVLKGDFSRLIVRELQPERLHLVDPWYLQGTEWSWEGGDRSTVHALSGVLQIFEQELARGQVVLNISYDQDFLTTLPDGYFDWVYLDTTHEYAQTKLELQLLQRKVKPSGVIVGDDWQPDPTHPHHGVYKAVQELIAAGDYRILYADTYNLQWVIGRVICRSDTP